MGPLQGLEGQRLQMVMDMLGQVITLLGGEWTGGGASSALTDVQLRASPVNVAGPLTDAELRAAAVPVSGPMTDAQMRAAPVPVSGPLTDAQMRATPVAVAVDGTMFETVAAGQADQVLGAAGAAGDLLAGLQIIPLTTAPGTVSIKDGEGAAITVFVGGADSVSNLVPFPISLGIRSATGAWSVTTGANVALIAVGDFT